MPAPAALRCVCRSVITRKRGADCNHSCYDIFSETITGAYMNLRQLEILRAVIRHRTTVAAADELALSQPAISNALKAMETQAGFALFERVNNRLFPTTEAMALYKESDAIFALHAKLENRVRDLRECRSGHLSIVATPPLAYSIIPPALSGFLHRRQQTRVFFDVRRYEGIIDGVLSRVAELGFALGLSHHPGIAHEVVHTGEMVCVLPPRHPLAERQIISASDLVGSPFIGLERGTRLVRPYPRALRKPARRSSQPSRCDTATRPACSRPPAWVLRWSIRFRRARAAATTLSSGLSPPKQWPWPTCCGPKRSLYRVWPRHS
jgi:DNA-binding transcriptional LysR family regulator